MSSGLLALILGATAWAALMGYSPFVDAAALSEKLDATEERLTEVLEKQESAYIRQLESNILTARRMQCESRSNDGNTRFFTERLQTLRSEYYKATGREYPIQDC